MTKYNARRTEVEGITFASKREAQRYQELRLLEQAGEISGLVLQHRMPLFVYDFPNEVPVQIAVYVADFCYIRRDPITGKSQFVFEDVKGVRTPMYRLKCKWMKAQYGIEIQEV